MIFGKKATLKSLRTGRKIKKKIKNVFYNSDIILYIYNHINYKAWKRDFI